MTAIQWATLVGWNIIVGVWQVLLLAQLIAKQRGLIPAGPEAGAPAVDGPLPSVDLIISACNESEHIAGCLDSVLRQSYANLRVTVVDDRSSDDTPDIVRRYERKDSRVHLMQIHELPERWMGKSHALWQASKQSSAQWLLFLDADCRLESDALRHAVNQALANNASFVTLWPKHRGGSFWEHMLIPLCGGIIALWFGGINPGSKGQTPFGNGQFILCKTDAYRAMGGHESVRSALIEDVCLAKQAKQSGLQCWVGCGRDYVSVRMYDGFRSACNGWTRIFTGALRSGSKLILSVLWLLLGSLLPFIVAPYLIELLIKGQANSFYQWAMLGTCAMHLLFMFIVSYRFWGLGYCDRRYLWLYPVSVVVVMGMLLRSSWWLLVRRRVRWRTTEYKIDRSGAIVC